MAKSSTSFKPGKSGNPNGRPRVVGEIRERAQARAAEFYAVVERIALDVEEDNKLRLQAAKIGLSIAGVSMNAVEVSGEVKTSDSNPYSERPTSELLSRASTSSTLAQ